MKIIENPTKIRQLWENREVDFTELMKVVVDIEKEILAIDAEMHADLENLLLKNGSEQKNLWGANVYPQKNNDEFIEYTSFINIKPNQNNRSMEILDDDLKNMVKEIILNLLKET
jgi:hypothetical protein